MKALLSYSTFAFGSFLGLGLRFVQNVLLTRSAGADAFGIYIAILVFPLIAARLVDLSLPQALSYFVRRDLNQFPRAIAIAGLHTLAMAPVMVGLAYAQNWLPADSEVVRHATMHLAVPIACVMIATSLSGCLIALLIAIETFRTYAMLNALSPLCMIAGGLALSAHRPLDFTSLLFLTAGSEGLTAFAAVVAAWMKSRHRSPTSSLDLREVYQYGLKAHPGVSAKIFGSRLDRLILIALLPPRALAIYSVAMNIRDLISQPVLMYGTMFTNRLITMINSPNLNRFLRLNFFWVTCLLLPVTLVAMAFSRWFFAAFYGSSFEEAGTLFRIAAPSVILSAITGLLWSLFYAKRRPDLVSLAILTSTVPGLALLYWLVRRAGIEGAAWAALISQFAGFAISAFLALRLLGGLAQVSEQPA